MVRQDSLLLNARPTTPFSAAAAPVNVGVGLSKIAFEIAKKLSP